LDTFAAFGALTNLLINGATPNQQRHRCPKRVEPGKYKKSENFLWITQLPQLGTKQKTADFRAPFYTLPPLFIALLVEIVLAKREPESCLFFGHPYVWAMSSIRSVDHRHWVRRELKWAWGWEKHHQLSIAPVHFSVGFYFHALCFVAMRFDSILFDSFVFKNKFPFVLISPSVGIFLCFAILIIG